MIKEFFQELSSRQKLIKAFKTAGIYKTVGQDERKIFPKIHNVPNSKYNYYYFSLLNGIDPKVLKQKFYVFQQIFGQNVAIEGEYKNFKLSIKETAFIDKVDYDYEEILKIIEKEKIIIPIVCGKNEKGELIMYDATNSPNLLLFGEPGSGKSTILHAILCTLMQLYGPKQIEFYLADFKMSELNLYEEVEHVKSVSYLEKDLGPALAYLKSELTRRGELLKKYKVRHINKVPETENKPYIVLCIDEFVMIQNPDTMTELLQIASLGRAYGIYLILSMQRPSHKIISTDIRGLLSVRMGFRTVDKRNAMIGECPGSETIPQKGYEGTFFLKTDGLEQLRAPYLNEDQTEAIIEQFKITGWKNHNYKKQVEKQGEPSTTESEVFNDVN